MFIEWQTQCILYQPKTYRTFQQQCLNNNTHTYCNCPAIGDCEVLQYELPLPLNTINRTTEVDNATYYIRVTAVNNAQLSTTKEVTFMIEFARGMVTRTNAYSWGYIVIFMFYTLNVDHLK